MKNKQLACLLVLVATVCVPAVLLAKRNLGDYPLRLHIYGTNWTHNGWGYHAYGRANLFDEHGLPHGIEYTYDCPDHMMASNANEALPARWKKQNESIEVVYGEIGEKPDDFHTCEFKVAMKTFVFYRHNGGLDTESPQDFMARHSNQAPPVNAPGQPEVPVTANPRP